MQQEVVDVHINLARGAGNTTVTDAIPSLRTQEATSANPVDTSSNQKQESHPFAIGGLHEGWSLASFKFIQGWEQPANNPTEQAKKIPSNQENPTFQNSDQPGSTVTGNVQQHDSLWLPSIFNNWPWGDAFSGQTKVSKTELKTSGSAEVQPPSPPPLSKAKAEVNPFKSSSSTGADAHSASQEQQQTIEMPVVKTVQVGPRTKEQVSVTQRAEELQAAAREALRNSEEVWQAVSAAMDADRELSSAAVRPRALPSKRPLHADGLPVFYSWLPPATVLKEDRVQISPLHCPLV